jgi:hypothetical protein
MSFLLRLALLALVLAVPSLAAGYVYYNSALSPDDWVYQGNGRWQDGGLHAAPGPAMGAGLPILIIGGGYWLARRLRRRAN